MRIVMDFDGVFTDPSEEGDACSRKFRDAILGLGLKELNLGSPDQVDSWFGELRARMASHPYEFGWRSEGRVSAFSFEDPFIRNIGIADFLDDQILKGDAKAKKILTALKAQNKIESFGALSEDSFHQLTMKKRPDPQAKRFVADAIEKGHEVFIVSNSASDKIGLFVNNASYSHVLTCLRPPVMKPVPL